MKKTFNIRLLGLAILLIISTGIKASTDSSQLVIRLIERIIEQKNSLLIPDSGVMLFDRYEKFNAGFTNLTPKEEQIFLFNYINFVRINKDTSDLTGDPINYILTKERFESIAQLCESPYEERVRVHGSKDEWIDLLGHDPGIRTVVDEVLTPVNIYDDSLKTLLGQSFIGPFSTNIATKLYHYKYQNEGDLFHSIPTIWIECTPKYTHFRGIKGRLRITNESNPKVVSVDIVLANAEYLNLIDHVRIVQEFGYDKGVYRLLKNDISTELSIFKLFLRRSFFFSNYSHIKEFPDIYSASNPISYDRDAFNKPEIYWQNVRPLPIQLQEENVRNEVKKLLKPNNESKGIGFWGFAGDLIINNNISIGAVDLNPIFSFISRNDIEGYRFRIGGMTNSKMSPHLFFKGYGAYGEMDNLFKYHAEAIYSFKKQYTTPYDFPHHYVSLRIGRDLKTPGQELITVNKDNAFYSFRQSPLERMLMVEEMQAQYIKEYNTGIAFQVAVNRRNERAAGKWKFQQLSSNQQTVDMTEVRIADIELGVKYAPGEKFYQNRTRRSYLTRYAPIITITHKIGVAGLFNSNTTYQKTEFGLLQTYTHPIIGEFRSGLKLGKLWSNVPAPLLIYPQANSSWFNVRESFNMMNVMEFAYDSYASIDLEHHFNGLFLNFIPVNRWGKLREVIGIKSIWGNLSSKNRIGEHGNNYHLPVDLQGNYISHAPGITPYAECSVGIENILRFIRLDYVWRLTYLDRPNINKSGLRITANLKF